MRIFIDTADVGLIEFWHEAGVVAGCTTNPLLTSQLDVDLEYHIKRIASVLDTYPVSVQLRTAEDIEGFVEQAQSVRAWAQNIVIKIPIVRPDGKPQLKLIRTLREHGFAINVTACFSAGQALLAAAAGARYVSILIGRIADEGGDPVGVCKVTRQGLDDSGGDCEVIAASLRGPADFYAAVLGGAHIATVPPAVLEKLVDHKFSRHTVSQLDDAGA